MEEKKKFFDQNIFDEINVKIYVKEWYWYLKGGLQIEGGWGIKSEFYLY